jgi:hypothetical protein
VGTDLREADGLRHRSYLEAPGPRAQPSPGRWGAEGELVWAALLKRVFALDVFSVTARRRPAATRWGPNRRRAPAGLARAARLRDRLAIRRAIALAAATGSVAAHATRPGIPSPIRTSRRRLPPGFLLARAAPGFFSTWAPLSTDRRPSEPRRRESPSVPDSLAGGRMGFGEGQARATTPRSRRDAGRPHRSPGCGCCAQRWALTCSRMRLRPALPEALQWQMDG